MCVIIDCANQSFFCQTLLLISDDISITHYGDVDEVLCDLYGLSSPIIQWPKRGSWLSGPTIGNTFIKSSSSSSFYLGPGPEIHPYPSHPNPIHPPTYSTKVLHPSIYGYYHHSSPSKQILILNFKF